MKNDKIVDVYNAVKLSDDAKERIRANIMPMVGTNRKRQIYKRVMVLATAAAVLLFAFFGTNRLSPNIDNFFAIRVYAMEQQANGSIALREVDFADLSSDWGGYFDGETFYVSIGLRYDGDNIKSVTFFTDNGFFATQDIGGLTRSPLILAGPERQLVMRGTEFNILGNTLTFGNAMDDDLLLFWGSQVINNNFDLSDIEIRVEVTFDDGEVDEQIIVIGFTVPGWVFEEENTIPERYESQRVVSLTQEQHDYFMNIPLEECKLMPQSVRTITDVFVFDIGNNRPVSIFIEDFITEDGDYPLNENGIWRIPYGIWDDEGFLVVIKRDGNGVLTGMVYIVK
jgi:hypothetical protein